MDVSNTEFLSEGHLFTWTMSMEALGDVKAQVDKDQFHDAVSGLVAVEDFLRPMASDYAEDHDVQILLGYVMAAKLHCKKARQASEQGNWEEILHRKDRIVQTIGYL